MCLCEYVTNLLCNLADPGRGAVGKVRPSGAPTHWRLHALIGGYTCRDRQDGADRWREEEQFVLKGPEVVRHFVFLLARVFPCVFYPCRKIKNSNYIF